MSDGYYEGGNEHFEMGKEHGRTMPEADAMTTQAPDATVEALLDRAITIIETADNRAMAADGPVGHVRDEMSDKEWRDLYVSLTKARSALAALPGYRLVPVEEWERLNGGLDAAWAAVEAVLPEDGRLTAIFETWDRDMHRVGHTGLHQSRTGAIAALRSLARGRALTEDGS